MISKRLLQAAAIVAGFAGIVAIHVDLRAQPKTEALKILVIEGEGAVNILQQRSAVAPVVEVRDRNDLPLAGVPVTFTVTGAKTATFAGGAQTLTITTNAAGRAAAAGFTPLTNGAVQVNVAATLQGQTVTATISQVNVATAAQASSAAGGSSGAGGGGSAAKAIAIVGAAAGGAAGALTFLKKESDPASEAPALSFCQPPGAEVYGTFFEFNTNGVTSGLAASSIFIFRAQVAFGTSECLDTRPGLTYSWDFGDGTTSTAPPPVEHVFQDAGTYDIRVTVSDGSLSATRVGARILIFGLTGTWRAESSCGRGVLGTGAASFLLDLTQSRLAFSGSAPPIAGPSGATGPSTLVGSMTPASRAADFQIRLDMSTAAGTLNGLPASFPTSRVDLINGRQGFTNNPNTLYGNMNPCPGGGTSEVILRRQ